MPPRRPAPAPAAPGTSGRTPSPDAGSAAPPPLEVADAFYAAFDAHDLDTWVSLMDEEVEITVDGGGLHGRAGARIYVDGILRTYPGVVTASRRVVAASAECVVSEFHLRNPAGVPAPGSRTDEQPWRLEGLVCEVLRVVRGRIVAVKSYYSPTADDRTGAAQVPSRAEAARIAASHSALRRVAAHVAGGVPEQELFGVVNAAIAELTAADLAVLLRFEPGDVVTSLAVWSSTDVPLPAGDRSPADAAVLAVRDTGVAVRFGPAGPQPWGAFLHAARRARIRTSVAVPVLLNGQVWGVSVSGVVRDDPLPDDTEAAVEAFAGIVSTALATARADGELRRRALEQSELRQVAEIAARGGEPAEVFTAVAQGASRLLGGSPTSLLRAEDDGAWVIVADRNGHAPVGTRIPGTGASLTARVRSTRRAARIDDYAAVPGASRAAAAFGLRAAVGVPVIVEGRLWGMITASSSDLPLPPDTERRLSQFAELVSAAVSSAQARAALREVADEQAALRRVAELAAGGADQQELFAAVALEAAGLVQEVTLLGRMDGDRAYTLVAVQGGPATVGTRIEVPGDDQGLVAQILRTQRPARVDDYSGRRGRAYAHDDYGVQSSVGVPIVVDDRLWGVLGAISSGRPVAPGVEHRLAQFAELTAAALASAQARADLQRLADEQSALRAVAELVARAAPPQQVFDAVAAEASQLLGGTAATLSRFDGPDALVVVAARHGPTPLGTRIVYQADTLPDRVRTYGRSVRVDDYAGERDLALAARYGLAAAVAVPVVVAGEVWGLLTATSPDGPLGAATEGRLEQFAGLLGTSIFAAQARSDLQALAEEQAALRRVAETVARGADLDEVFVAVASEASRLLGDHSAALMRYDPGDVAVVVAAHRSPAPLGLRVPSDGDTGTGKVLRTGRPVRVDTFEGTTLEAMAREVGVRAAVAVPITVEGRVWGVLSTSSPGPPLPAGTEERLAGFARLAAAAIANAETRAKLTASRARVVAAGDESRRRLQRDVHDTAQQRLVHAVITLKLARDALLAGAPATDAAGLVDEALRNAERAGRELRDVVRGILPAALTVGGLRAGLESLVDDAALPVDLRVAVPRLPAALETTAYFVVAEALTNVVKHAGAACAVVDVTLDDDHLVIDVRDDGAGGADASRGSGLTGLHDRIDANDGALTITSPPGGGTTVHARIPVRP